MNKSRIKKEGKKVIKLESGALAKLSNSLDNNFVEAVELISNLNGKIIISGVGKSGKIASKISATLSSVGTPSFSISASYSIDISISEQRLYLYENKEIIRSYPVSSSAYGEGQIENSLKTPLGMHEVKTKIGTNVDKYHFFVSREHIPQKVNIIHGDVDSDDDFITSRIMWLSGLSEGFNKGTNVDSFKRYIYIHGTHEEGLIGKKASHGCIRMLNHDVLELYKLIPEETIVNIYL